MYKRPQGSKSKILSLGLLVGFLFLMIIVARSPVYGVANSEALRLASKSLSASQIEPNGTLPRHDILINKNGNNTGNMPPSSSFPIKNIGKEVNVKNLPTCT